MAKACNKPMAQRSYPLSKSTGSNCCGVCEYGPGITEMAFVQVPSVDSVTTQGVMGNTERLSHQLQGVDSTPESIGKKMVNQRVLGVDNGKG